MTKAERELQAIRHKLTEWEWKVALAIFKIPPGRLITYRSLSILATGTDASRAAANLRQKLIRLLGVRTQVPLHRIAKKGDLGAKADWPEQKRGVILKRRKREGTPQDDGAWWYPELPC